MIALVCGDDRCNPIHFLRACIRATTSYPSNNFTLDTLYYLTYHTARGGTKWNGVEQRVRQVERAR